MDARSLLADLLKARLSPEGNRWLEERALAARKNGGDASFLMAFSAVPRRTGRADLSLSEAEMRRAAEVRAGFHPQHWTVDQAARALLVLSLPATDPDRYAKTFDRLFEDAELGELVALYQMLPLVAFPEAHRARAAEGIRTNIKAVFEAVALDNPYPSEQLGDLAWNQLVLKACFIGSPLHRVFGIDERVNPPLARMLGDYAHERWAAGRPVNAQLWRCVGPIATGTLIDDLRKVLATGSDIERCAAALSCSKNPEASELRRQFSDVFARLEREGLDWSHIAAAEG